MIIRDPDNMLPFCLVLQGLPPPHVATHWLPKRVTFCGHGIRSFRRFGLCEGTQRSCLFPGPDLEVIYVAGLLVNS